MKGFLGKTSVLFAGMVMAGMLLAPAAHGFAQAKKPDATESREANTSGSREASTPEAQVPRKEEEADEDDAYRKSPMVRSLGGKLGLNPDQSATAFEVLNFVALASLLGWLLARMLPKAFRTRNTSIQKHLVDARTATEEASVRLGSVEARLARLDEDIAGMRAQAEKDAALDEQRIRAAVEDEKQKILAAADQEIAAATTQAHRQLQRYAAELAIEQAGRNLVIDAETDRALVQNFAQRLAEEATSGQNGTDLNGTGQNGAGRNGNGGGQS